MIDEKYTLRDHLIRGGIGGVLGLLVLPAICRLLGAAAALGAKLPPSELVGEVPAGIVNFLLYFLLGALCGVATMPFADSGRELIIRSSVHYLLTAAIFSGLCWFNGWNRGRWDAWLLLLGVLAAVYLIIWIARWIGWIGDILDIREKLGIAPRPSPLLIVESLPYAALVLLSALVVSYGSFALDGTGFFGTLVTWLIIPAGIFLVGLVSGKHIGFSVSYVLLSELGTLSAFAVAVFALGLRLGIEWWAYPVPAICAAAGSLAGMAIRKLKKS